MCIGIREQKCAKMTINIPISQNKVLKGGKVIFVAHYVGIELHCVWPCWMGLFCPALSFLVLYGIV